MVVTFSLFHLKSSVVCKVRLPAGPLELEIIGRNKLKGNEMKKGIKGKQNRIK